MRILHTSDWHLGRKFGEHSLLPDQITFLDWLVEIVEEYSVDLVAVAGDVYDRSNPSGESVAAFADVLRALVATDTKVVAIAGNHDNAMRFDAFDGITDASGVLVRGGYRRCSDVVVWQFDQVELAIVAIPFLDPQLSPGGVELRLTHEGVLATALEKAKGNIPKGARSLVLSHAFVGGGVVSDSERELSVGTAGMVSSELFSGFDYVALGHLHRPQNLGGDTSMRYSGSPIAYSFGETSQKSVTIVDLDSIGQAQIEVLDIPVGRGVQTVRGEISELCVGERSELWTRVELTDVRPVLDAQRRLRDRFPKVVEIARVGGLVPDLDARLTISAVRSMKPAVLAGEFWLDVTGEEALAIEADAMTQALQSSDLP